MACARFCYHYALSKHVMQATYLGIRSHEYVRLGARSSQHIGLDASDVRPYRKVTADAPRRTVFQKPMRFQGPHLVLKDELPFVSWIYNVSSHYCSTLKMKDGRPDSHDLLAGPRICLIFRRTTRRMRAMRRKPTVRASATWAEDQCMMDRQRDVGPAKATKFDGWNPVLI